MVFRSALWIGCRMLAGYMRDSAAVGRAPVRAQRPGGSNHHRYRHRPRCLAGEHRLCFSCLSRNHWALDRPLTPMKPRIHYTKPSITGKEIKSKPGGSFVTADPELTGRANGYLCCVTLKAAS